MAFLFRLGFAGAPLRVTYLAAAKPSGFKQLANARLLNALLGALGGEEATSNPTGVYANMSPYFVGWADQSRFDGDFI